MKLNQTLRDVCWLFGWPDRLTSEAIRLRKALGKPSIG